MPGNAAQETRAARYAVYLLYWYKSTNTDAIPQGQEAQHRKRKREEPRASARDSMQVPASVFVLLYEESK